MRLSILNFKRLAIIAIASAAIAWTGFRVVEVQIGFAVPENKTEAWLGNTARMRELLYASQSENEKKTIYIVSGSNSLFSIASDILAASTGFNVKNYSLHAGMHIDILFSQIKNKVKNGDIIVAPIEWETRNRSTFNKFDYENYLHHFSRSVDPSPHVLYNLFSSVPLRRWTAGINTYLYQPHDAQSYWDFYTNESLQYTWDHREANVNYSHRALNKFGDINIEMPMTAATWSDKSAFQVPGKVDAKWVEQLESWNTFFKEKGATLFLTAPILLDGNNSNLFSVDTWRKINNIRDGMADTDIQLNCDPVTATFSSIYRYDTSYHANAEGARRRTKELSECLVNFIAQKDVRTKPIIPEEIPDIIRKRFIGQNSNFGSGNMLFQMRLRRLTKINNELEKYYAINSKYPKSIRSQDFGEPEFDGEKINDELGIIYWSNEVGYKLIAKAPKIECPVVNAIWPELIDPVGLENNDPMQCTGFGYWSKDKKSYDL